MSKIRINELARELEVKPNVILELLPELGVTDKKTHSSSLDDDVALQVRRRVAGEAAAAKPRASREQPNRGRSCAGSRSRVEAASAPVPKQRASAGPRRSPSRP